MNILFVSDRERFWANFYGAMRFLIDRGHTVESAMVPGKKWAQIDLAMEEMTRRGLDAAHVWSPVPPTISLLNWYAGLLWMRRWDAVVVCPEHLTPMRWTKWLLSQPAAPGIEESPTPVIAMQHGLAQKPYQKQPVYCDQFLAWSEIQRDVMLGGHVHVTVTGTSRFERFRPEDATDEGHILAIAPSPTDEWGHGPGGEWLERVKAMATGRMVIVKVHPNDLTFTPPPDTPELAWLPADQPPHEAMRTAHAVYMEYPSSCLLEAKAYGKKLILTDWPQQFVDALEPGDAAPRLADAIESLARKDAS